MKMSEILQVIILYFKYSGISIYGHFWESHNLSVNREIVRKSNELYTIVDGTLFVRKLWNVRKSSVRKSRSHYIP